MTSEGFPVAALDFYDDLAGSAYLTKTDARAGLAERLGRALPDASALEAALARKADFCGVPAELA
ncbi:hypothetical protein [Nocardioides montaniterrae]